MSVRFLQDRGGPADDADADDDAREHERIAGDA